MAAMEEFSNLKQGPSQDVHTYTYIDRARRLTPVLVTTSKISTAILVSKCLQEFVKQQPADEIRDATADRDDELKMERLRRVVARLLPHTLPRMQLQDNPDLTPREMEAAVQLSMALAQ